MKSRELFLTAFSVALAGGGLPLCSQDVLPKSDPPFQGKIGRTYKESQPEKIRVRRREV